MLLHFLAHGLRQAMKFDNFIERRFVKRAADEPAVVPITVKVVLTQILDPDEAFRRIAKINFWRPDSMGLQKFRDLDVMRFSSRSRLYLTRISVWFCEQ